MDTVMYIFFMANADNLFKPRLFTNIADVEAYLLKTWKKPVFIAADFVDGFGCREGDDHRSIRLNDATVGHLWLVRPE